jgi:hypothetical protein
MPHQQKLQQFHGMMVLEAPPRVLLPLLLLLPTTVIRLIPLLPLLLLVMPMLHPLLML